MRRLTENALAAVASGLVMLGYGTHTEVRAQEAPIGYERYVTGIGWVDFELLIAGDGGRVSWYRGGEHERIAFDSHVAPGRIEVFTINPDGSDRRCVTCDSPGLELARNLAPDDRYGELVGQPEWYPLGGELLLVQVENEHSTDSFKEHPSWGINNDLWMLEEDGAQAQKVYDTPAGQAALHPHFNRFGTQLIFASKLWSANPWLRWHIHRSDVDIARLGQNRLTSHAALQPAGAGFYETHGFAGTLQGWMTFSFTPEGAGLFVQDSYAATIAGTSAARLTEEPTSWTEHATYSPSGASLAYNSSSPFGWRPIVGVSGLRTELFLKKGEETYQITAMNQDRDPVNFQYVVSDFDWDQDGRRLVVQVAVNASGGLPLWVENWIVTFPQPQ
ncbi:MAG: hypothetical protein OEU09_17920 [Rhodospirillales bacterium]|nr:hypothetical protein [Rhodospirillales bacterium]MDH3790441.1 hypothetical protein [Rhodospirillales bacterium]MDH3913166.1 hypothetical protein [Rhodospirillales bacterium]MDH3966014.1 hypothetical protein [Rhodospirillales bacterium]